ncbi:MAG: DUF4301 family protein [Bacteroidales bacterium]
MFTENDLKDLKERGITLDAVEGQLSRFREGFPFLPVSKPATAGDGILQPAEDTLSDFIQLYETKSVNEKIMKFVPASGAATRMFRDLYTFLENKGKDSDRAFINEFISGLTSFAFYDDLKICLKKQDMDPESLVNKGDYIPIIECLLNKNGLNYGNLPKGLLSFHKYDGKSRTAFEEHLVEGALYCKGDKDIVKIHFTVSPEHQKSFELLLDKVKDDFERKYKVNFSVEFSHQHSSTDTIAVDPDNNPFRDKYGKLVFRPGGHGALLDNLAGLDADILFIKNIDNVVPDHLKEETIRYKKALGGMLFSFRERVFDYLGMLYSNNNNGDGLLDEIGIFLNDELCVIPPWGMDQWSSEEKRRYLISKLNRPIRICGMVKNEGDPGGGPFWVKNGDGSVSLQIVESSQINLSNPLMKKLFNASTHFNPVDLVCSVKDYKGNRFDPERFRDADTGFISNKSVDGIKIKALELPGLWNGGMSDWITVFVEVPRSTFNPVKTINDLLRPQHSSG